MFAHRLMSLARLWYRRPHALSSPGSWLPAARTYPGATALRRFAPSYLTDGTCVPVRPVLWSWIPLQSADSRKSTKALSNHFGYTLSAVALLFGGERGLQQGMPGTIGNKISRSPLRRGAWIATRRFCSATSAAFLSLSSSEGSVDCNSSLGTVFGALACRSPLRRGAWIATTVRYNPRLRRSSRSPLRRGAWIATAAQRGPTTAAACRSPLRRGAWIAT